MERLLHLIADQHPHQDAPRGCLLGVHQVSALSRRPTMNGSMRNSFFRIASLAVAEHDTASRQLVGDVAYSVNQKHGAMPFVCARSENRGELDLAVVDDETPMDMVRSEQHAAGVVHALL